MFWENFWPNFISTLIGVFVAGILSALTILWQIKKQNTSIYISTLKTLLVEVADNKKTMLEGEKFKLIMGDIKHELLMTEFSKIALDGALSSERLNHINSDKITNKLLMHSKKIYMHNITEAMIISNLGIFTSDKPEFLNWLIENLNEKQLLLTVDFDMIIDALTVEILKYDKTTHIN